MNNFRKNDERTRAAPGNHRAGEVDADLRLNDIIVNKSQIKMITDVNELLNDFNNLCNASPKQMCARMEWEAEEELLEASSAKATHGRTMPARSVVGGLVAAGQVTHRYSGTFGQRSTPCSR